MKFIPKVKERGSVLLLSLFFMFTLFLLAVAFFRLLPTELHSAARASSSMKGHFAADAALRQTVEWLRSQGAGGIPQANIDAYNAAWGHATAPGRTVEGTWSYTCEITAAGANGIFHVDSIAYRNGQPYRNLIATVQNQSFAKYALFINTWNEGAGFFTMASDGIQGPFHTNDYFRLWAPSSDPNAFWADGETPWVTAIRDNGGNIVQPAEMTQSTNFSATDNELGILGDGIQYLNGNFNGTDEGLRPYDANGNDILNPDGSSRYERMIEGGRSRITTVQTIEMPENITTLRAKAWHDDPNAVATDFNDYPSGWSNRGMYVNTDNGPNAEGSVEGGIFVERDAQMDLYVIDGDGDGTTELQKIQITQNWEQVVGSTSSQWTADVEYHEVWVPQPDLQEPIYGDCIASHTVYDPIYGPEYDCSYDDYGQHPSCGQETIYVPGPGGIITPQTVNKSCTYTVSQTCQDITGYDPREVCDQQEITGYTNVPQPDIRLAPVDPNAYPGATPYYQNEVVDPNYPGAVEETVENMEWIKAKDAVIEVNDGTFKIPFPELPDGSPDTATGVMVNGVKITDPLDSALTVGDGNTVHIDHDDTRNGKYYGEFTVMSGRTNGVVFSDNHIWDLKGVNKGAKYEKDGVLEYRGRTIATDLRRTLEIEGNILQYYDGNDVDGSGNSLNSGNNTLVPGNQSPTADHILGIIAKDIYIDVEDRSWKFSDSGPYGPLTVYAVLMAGRKESSGAVSGGFGVRGNDMQNGDGLGMFELYGGIITGNARETQTLHVGSGTTNGFQLDLNYDWMAAQNLENFPTTQTFAVLRYVEVPIN